MAKTAYAGLEEPEVVCLGFLNSGSFSDELRAIPESHRPELFSVDPGGAILSCVEPVAIRATGVISWELLICTWDSHTQEKCTIVSAGMGIFP